MICRSASEAVSALGLLLTGCSTKKTPNENATEQSTVAAKVQTAEIPKWVTADAGPSRNCALSAAEETPDNSFFQLGGTTDAPDFRCRATGPFEWEGKPWFVFRIHSLTTIPESALPPGAPKVCSDAGLPSPCLFDGTRVCSKQAHNGDPTPAGTSAGPRGCAGLEPPKFRKKP